MAISIQGSRELQVKADPDKTDSAEMTCHPQFEGDVYLSNPSLFLHGVTYPETEWKSRVIAIQCRFGFKADQYSKCCRLLNPTVEKAVSQYLKQKTFRLPSLADCLAMEKELSTQHRCLLM